VSRGRDYIGPYRLLRLIRPGQASQIWEALSEADNRRVALKALQDKKAGDYEQIRLLRHEWEVGRNLQHPSVIHIFDFSDERDPAYLAMEYFPAPNLKQALRSGPEALAPLVGAIIERAAEGLGYFHDQGWLHRDVKPDNFLANEQGEVRLIDFAIAERPRKGLLSRLLNFWSKVQGTRSYMSPEQIRKETLDVRADVYSFGCTMYELLSGRPPYSGVNSDDLLNKHLRSPVPSLLAVSDSVTPEFAALTARLMAKRPEDRPASMAEVLAELRKVRILRVRTKPIPAPSKPEEQENR
jgi:serine/threonine protein kinase